MHHNLKFRYLAIALIALAFTGNAAGAVVLNSSESVDVNVTLNNQVAQFNSSGLDLKDNDLYYFENQCNNNEVVDGIHPNGTLKCSDVVQEAVETETLSETLEAGNTANQTIDMKSNTVENIGSGLTNFTSSGQIDMGSNLLMNNYGIDNANNIKFYDRSGDSNSFVITESASNPHLFLKYGGDNLLRFEDGNGVSSEINDFKLGTSGSGNDNISLYDEANNQDIVRAKEGGNVVIPNGNLDLNSNQLLGVGSTQCADNEFLDGNGECEAISDVGASDDQNLSEVLVQGNTANQTINMDGNEIKSVGKLNITNTSSGTQIATFQENGINFKQPLSVESSGPLSVANGIELTDTDSNTIDSYSTFYLKTSSGYDSDIVLEPTGNVNVDANLSVLGDVDFAQGQLQNVGSTECAADEFIDGDGKCTSVTDAGASTTDDQNLSEVLVQGNVANTSIDMSDDSIDDIATIDGGGNSIKVDDTLSMRENNITNVQKVENGPSSMYMDADNTDFGNNNLISTTSNDAVIGFNRNDNNAGSFRIVNGLDNKSDSDYDEIFSAKRDGEIEILMGNLNLSQNTLEGVGGTQCADDEFIDGLGDCTSVDDAGASTTDDQNLSEVLVQGETGNRSLRISATEGIDRKGFASVTKANDVYIRGKTAYVLGYTGSFHIFDISNPSNPVRLSEVTSGIGQGYNIDVQGKHAYIIDNDNDVQIFDISDKSNPTRVQTVSLNSPDDIVVEGRYAYVAQDTGVISVIDISDPSEAYKVADAGSGSYFRKIDVQGSYAFASDYNDNAVYVFDVSNPRNPSQIGSVTDSSLSGVHELRARGAYVYAISNTADSFVSVNVSKPSDPTLADSISTSGLINAYEFDFMGDKAVAGGDGNNLSVIDIGDPTNMNEVTLYEDSNLDEVWGLEIEGKHLYTGSDTTDYFNVYEIPGIEAPSAKIGSLETQDINTYGGIEADSVDARGEISAGSQGIQSDGDISADGDLNVSGSSELSGGLDLSGSSLTGVGSTECADNEFLDGQGECESVTDAGGSDDQRLDEVLSQGRYTDGKSILVNGSSQVEGDSGQNIDFAGGGVQVRDSSDSDIVRFRSDGVTELRPEGATNEGGQIQFTGAGSYGPMVLDRYQDQLRLYNSSDGTNIMTFYNDGRVQINNGDLQLAGNGYGIENVDEIHSMEQGGPSDPTYTYGSDEDSGIYSSGNENIGISTSGLSAINVTSSQNVQIVNGNLDLNSNQLLGVGSTQCADDEFLDGNGQCETVTDAGGSDDQNLSEVLSEGNIGDRDIRVLDSRINISETGTLAKAELEIERSDNDPTLTLDSRGAGEGVINFSHEGGQDWWIESGDAGGGDLTFQQGPSFTQTLKLTTENDVEVPNGNLDLQSNDIDDLNSIYSDNSQTNFFSGGASDTQTVSGIDSDGSLTTTSISLTDTEIESNAITKSGGELDSTVAGTQLTYNSGALDVDEGSGSGLDADTLDGQQGTYYNQSLSVNTGSTDDQISIDNTNSVTIDDDFQDSDADPGNEYQSLSEVLTNGTSTGSNNIDLNGQNLNNVDQISGDATEISVQNELNLSFNQLTGIGGTQCADGEFVDGIGECETPASNSDSQNLQYSLDNQPTESTDNQEIGIENGANITFKDMYELDDQDLSDVLVKDNTANQSVNMDGNDLNNVNQISGDSSAVKVSNNVDMQGNSVTSSSGEVCIGDACT